jgi:hypothetical protein
MQAPATNWTSVIENLDHEGFNIPDEASFCLLMSIYSRACKVQTCISDCGHWIPEVHNLSIESCRVRSRFMLSVGPYGRIQKDNCHS